ncbi:MAG: DUF2892 domain-containing protein [Parcubacteria group bacterium]
MKTKFLKFVSFFFVAVFIIIPGFVSAHQPRITESRLTEVPDPEISKAYYGKLTGTPDVYTITSKVPFNLYVGLLVPDIEGQKTDVSAVVFFKGKQIAFLDGTSLTWEKMFEKFGHDNYLKGPEYKVNAQPGEYQIGVFNAKNDSKYSLAIGEIEAFDAKEGINAVKLIPQLKKNFFNKSPIDFILSPFGWGSIVAMYLLAFIFGFAYRFILKKYAKGTVRGVEKNIGKPDRLLRFAIGVALLLLAITTSWSFILLFLSGFAIFEAIFSWCGFYATIGKNTCE